MSAEINADERIKTQTREENCHFNPFNNSKRPGSGKKYSILVSIFNVKNR